MCDPKKVRASGRGLQSNGVRVKDEADFKIYVEGAGEGQPDVQIIGPGGAKIPCKLQKVIIDFVWIISAFEKDLWFICRLFMLAIKIQL